MTTSELAHTATTEQPTEAKEEKTGITEKIAFGKEFASTLDTMINVWIAEFHATAHMTKRFQYSTIKTYMWVASVVFAAQISLYIDLATSKNLIHALSITVDVQNCLYRFLSCGSLMFSLAVFLLGVDTMRGRHKTAKPIESDVDRVMDLAYDDCSKPYYEYARITMLKEIDKALLHHRVMASERGIKMRIMSWGILVSVVMSLLTLLC